MLELYVERHDPDMLTMPGKVLHFAPEEDVQRLLGRNAALKYLAMDLSLDQVRRLGVRGASFQGDIQRLAVATDSLELVFCLHVLEHIRDDRQAIAEIERVLKPGRAAYIMVPFDPALEKTVGWAQPDPDCFYHIWAYALPDFKERLASFDYEEVTPSSFLSEDEICRYRIPPKEVVYRCVKRPQRNARPSAP